MAKFQDEPGDYEEPVDYIPPGPWDEASQDVPELPPEIAQGENVPAPPAPRGEGEEPPRPQMPPYPDVEEGFGAAYYRPRYNPNDWTLSESMLQQKRIPVINPGPLPSPYSWWPQQPGIPESMFQQGKGWTPTPQFQETVNLTPEGYSETITSPSNWLIPQPPRVQGPPMPQAPPRYGGGGGGYGGGGYAPRSFEEWLKLMGLNFLRYGGIQRI